MTPILAFDIETVPDIAGLRLLRDLDAKLSDRDVAEHAFQQRRAQTGQDFLPLHLHRVVAIACALREGDSFRCWSLGSPADGEGELLRRFFDGIEKYTPQLVSWNGGGFDLPVLHYRGLVHGVSAPPRAAAAVWSAISTKTSSATTSKSWDLLWKWWYRAPRATCERSSTASIEVAS